MEGIGVPCDSVMSATLVVEWMRLPGETSEVTDIIIVVATVVSTIITVAYIIVVMKSSQQYNTTGWSNCTCEHQ